MASFRFLLANSVNNIQRLIRIKKKPIYLAESTIFYHPSVLKNITLISKYVGIAFSDTSSKRYISQVLQKPLFVSFTVSYLFFIYLLIRC